MIKHWEEMTEFQQKMGSLYKPSDYALALFMEAAELTDSFQFKPWKSNQEEVLDYENLKREIVDCLFFLHHLAECFEIRPEELDKKFEEVLANNERRYHGSK